MGSVTRAQVVAGSNKGMLCLGLVGKDGQWAALMAAWGHFVERPACTCIGLCHCETLLCSVQASMRGRGSLTWTTLCDLSTVEHAPSYSTVMPWAPALFISALSALANSDQSHRYTR
jgi:hypothetical protein